jgi:hypothetical protein
MRGEAELARTLPSQRPRPEWSPDQPAPEDPTQSCVHTR